MAAMYSYLETSGTKDDHSELFFIPVRYAQSGKVGTDIFLAGICA